jgi:hypothetical protein
MSFVHRAITPDIIERPGSLKRETNNPGHPIVPGVMGPAETYNTHTSPLRVTRACAPYRRPLAEEAASEQASAAAEPSLQKP